MGSIGVMAAARERDCALRGSSGTMNSLSRGRVVLPKGVALKRSCDEGILHLWPFMESDRFLVESGSRDGERKGNTPVSFLHGVILETWLL